MADKITLTLESRTVTGKDVKKLRRAGTIPVHLYGPTLPSRLLQCTGADLLRALNQAGRATPLFITLPDQAEEQLAFVREVQWDPVRGNLLHVDFLQAELSQRVSAEVPIILEGESQAAKEAGGAVNQMMRTLTVDALPLDMPASIRVDISALTDIASVLRVGDAVLPAGVTSSIDPEELVARIDMPRAAQEQGEQESAEQESESAG